MTAVLVPNRPGDKGGYQQLAPEDMPDLLKIDSDNLDDHLLPDRLKRRMVKKNKKGKKGNQKNLSDSDAALMKSDADLLKSKAADAAAEAAGVRPPPMFREVVWNEYCVLFPDGSHTPFNDEVRYTNLRGYLRKRHVVTDGGTEHALQYGSPRRGWHRHYIYANLKLLAWFEVDPEATPTPTPLQNLKLSLSRGKGLGSVHLDTSDCHLYAHRQYPNEFAVRFSSEVARSKCPPWQCPSSAPAPSQGAPGGSVQLGTPRAGPGQWDPSHGLQGLALAAVLSEVAGSQWNSASG